MRSGTVKEVNSRRGMVGILTEDDAFTIIELLSEDEFQVGDFLTWEDGYGMGHTDYRNVTKGFVAEVYVQNHSVHASLLRVQLQV